MKIRKYSELDEKRNIAYKNLYDAAKVVMRRKFLALKAYSRK